MKKVLLICESGISSNFLAKSARPFIELYDAKIELIPTNIDNADTYLGDPIDLVLVAPQASYHKKNLNCLTAQRKLKQFLTRFMVGQTVRNSLSSSWPNYLRLGPLKMTDEQLNGIAMKMLTYSGKAKSILSDLMDHLNSSSHDSDIDAQLNEAHQWLVQAHQQQNLVIAEAETVGYSLLFTHAQDTLMNTETIEFVIRKSIAAFTNHS